MPEPRQGRQADAQHPLVIAQAKQLGPLSAAGKEIWHGQATPCVTCGQLIPRTGKTCDACGQEHNDDILRKMARHSGPWFVYDTVRPFPGVSLERMQRLIDRGALSRTSIVRGPTTLYQWRFATETPLIARLLGHCWNCQAPATEVQACSGCGVSLDGRGDQVETEDFMPEDLEDIDPHLRALGETIAANAAGRRRPREPGLNKITVLCFFVAVAIVLAMVMLAGCQAPEPQGTSVTRRLQSSDPSARQVAAPQPDEAQKATANTPVELNDTGPGLALATVNGVPLQRSRFDALLLEGHGLFVLEQLISLSLVDAELERQGLSISEADVDWELKHSLQELGGEAMLAEVLRGKNVSRAEFMNGMRRNAGLRRLTAPEIVVDEDSVRAAFVKTYGRKAVVRHIEVPSPAIASEVRQRLSRGEAFSELAVRLSKNPTTASSGGLLAPFARNDDAMPDLMREVVFGLEPGQISSVVMIDGQRHLFLLGALIPEQHAAMTPALAAPIRETLREQRLRQAMRELETRLFEEASIEIDDAVLDQQFRGKYQDRTPGPQDP